MIKQDKSGKWWLHFSDGHKEGPFPSQARVMAREKQVNYFKYKNQHESMLNEGLKSWTMGKVTKAGKEVGDVAGAEIRKKIHQAATEAVQAYGPEVKRAAKKFILGVGGASLIGAGTGAYIGNKAAIKKKKIKESDPMLFSFAIGMNSALSRERDEAPNCLIQEGLGSALKKILGMSDKAVAIAKIKGGPLPISKLGKAMYQNPKAMNQAFRLYGPKSKTIKKTLPIAFGRLKQGV